jgi:hypothetical protein
MVAAQGGPRRCNVSALRLPPPPPPPFLLLLVLEERANTHKAMHRQTSISQAWRAGARHRQGTRQVEWPPHVTVFVGLVCRLIALMASDAPLCRPRAALAGLSQKFWGSSVMSGRPWAAILVGPKEPLGRFSLNPAASVHSSAFLPAAGLACTWGPLLVDNPLLCTSVPLLQRYIDICRLISVSGF